MMKNRLIKEEFEHKSQLQQIKKKKKKDDGRYKVMKY